MSAVLAYLSAALITAWGTAHAIPTRQVLAGFSPIGPDNRRIIQQEWLAEAVTIVPGDAGTALKGRLRKVEALLNGPALVRGPVARERPARLQH